MHTPTTTPAPVAVRPTALAGRYLTIAVTDAAGAVTTREIELDSDFGRPFYNSGAIAQREPIGDALDELLDTDAVQRAIDDLDAQNAADELADYQASHGRRRGGVRW